MLNLSLVYRALNIEDEDQEKDNEDLESYCACAGFASSGKGNLDSVAKIVCLEKLELSYIIPSICNGQANGRELEMRQDH